MQQAAQAGRASRQLFEQSTTLERIVRQYLILEDSALLDDYGRVRQEFRATTRQLALLPLSPDQLATLEGLGDSEARLNQLLRISPRPQNAHTQLADGYSKLADGAQSLLGATNELTERAIVQLEDIAAQGRQKWRYLAFATAGHRAGAGHSVRRADRAPDPPARPGDPADGDRGLHASDRGQRPAGSALPRPASRMAALAAVRSRGAAEPLPAPCFARVEDAAHRGARGCRAPPRQCRRQARGGAARDRPHRPREHAVAAEADRGPAHLPSDARHGAADAWDPYFCPTCSAAS